MSKKDYTVTVASCDTGTEHEVIRQGLESLPIRVIHEAIDRPSDFVDFLSGDTYFSSDFVIFNFHGVDGKFYMPELAESVYYEDDPRGNFGSEKIIQYAKLKTPFVINLGCSLGTQAMANAFLANTCHKYIGATDDVDGSSGKFFAVRFFYELCQNQRTEKEAFELARGTDSETMLFKWFE